MMTALRYVLGDHLGGTNLVTDDAGSIVETLDYYPYGGLRIDAKAGSYEGEKRKYIGQEYDAGTQLSYLNARYYDSGRGQFVSQDPVFWEKQNLADPQSMNSYSYALNNPVAQKDPTGRVPATIASAWQSIMSAWNSLLASFASFMGGGGTSPGSQGSTGGAPTRNISTPSSGSGVWVSQYSLSDSDTACLRACSKMAGYNEFGTPINTVMMSGGKLITQSDAKKGVEVIDAYLAQNREIIVGVNWNNGTQASNANVASQHFVTVDYSGQDSGGKYYHFKDPGTHHESLGNSPQNKLYVNSDYSLTGKSAYNSDTKYYVVTEVKPSK